MAVNSVKVRLTVQSLSVPYGSVYGSLGSENGLQFWSPKLPLDGTTQELFWHQKNSDTRTLLTPELFGHQNFSGTRILLIPELCWHQSFSGTRILLTPEL